MKTVLLTASALIAFAANSLLCRMALGQGLIDAATFTTLRVSSGALALCALVTLRGGSWPSRPRVSMVIGLFAYMAGFSFAYLSLDTGTGALILFGVVQLSMFVVALRSGETFSRRAWLGFGMAVIGLLWQVSPGVSAPDPRGAVLMTVAGIGWAAYTLLGRGSRQPLTTTATNFVAVVPLVLLISFAMRDDMQLSAAGVGLAMVSGAVTSGVGYAIWYAVLPALRATHAATAQLAVPALAAVGGVLVLHEPISLRLVGASVLTLGGIAVVVLDRS